MESGSATLVSANFQKPVCRRVYPNIGRDRDEAQSPIIELMPFTNLFNSLAGCFFFRLDEINAWLFRLRMTIESSLMSLF